MHFGKSTIVAFATALAVPSTSAQSIYEIAKSNEAFTTLVAAVDAAGLDAALSGPGNFTVFAPPNDAFAKLDPTAVTKLLEPAWIHHLTDVLTYHVLPVPVYSTDLTDGLTGTTLNGEDIIVNLDPPRINDASNLILDLVDIQADNGVIHAVDAVLLPTSVTSSIVDLASANPTFSTLVELVVAADLVEALSGTGPMTVFAPTNDAFAALPAGTVDSLKKAENKDQLVSILTYHVVGANAVSSDLTDGPVTTLQGGTVDIQTSPSVTVNGANVITADILANNGVIHVIDAVLLPEADGGTTTAPTAAPGPGGTTMAPTAAPGPGDSTAMPTTAADQPSRASGSAVLSVGAIAASAGFASLFL